MRGVDKGHIGLLMVFLVFNLVILVASTSHTANARTVPLLAGGLTLVLLMAVLINEVRPLPALQRFNIDLTKKYRSDDLAVPAEPETAQKKLFASVLGIVVFFLMILSFGFYLSIPVYTFIYMRAKGKASWIRAVLTAVMIDALIFVFFEAAMGVALFKGLVFGEILPAL